MNITANQITTDPVNPKTPDVPCSTNYYVRPVVDIYETPEGYSLQADLPGVAKEGLEISIENGTLTLVGRRTRNGTTGDRYYSESTDADYRRVFELDPAINAEKISAKLDQGVLTITLPKSDRAKARKVQIT